MKFSLETTIINPEPENEIKNAIVLLHGYGGDGKDISALSLSWKRYLKNTVFLCPNGHEKCNINPNGYQWFDLSNDDPIYILEQTLIAEKKLRIYINEVKKEYKLNNSKICLSGFSQGCMISINVGLTSSESFNSIIGFSGKIIDKDDLSKRIKSKCKILLIHGDLDTVVPPSNLLEAQDFMTRHKIDADILMIKNCEHHIPVEATSTALKFLKNNLDI